MGVNPSCEKGCKKIWISLPDCANPMIVGSRLVSSKHDGRSDNLQRVVVGEEGLEFQKARDAESDVISTFPLEEN